MKFKEIKKIIGEKYSLKDIKKAISEITPNDLNKQIKKNKKENSVIEIIKSKLI